MLEYIKLMRVNQPAGLFLLFWPCSFGLLLASNSNIPMFLLALFFIGSVIMRGAGCVINDIIDKDFDKHVARTKNRPIAKGTISVFQGIIFAIILSSIGLIILLSLPMKAVYVGFFSVLLILAYPFMKRITHYPQAFLAITFNIGAAIGYVSIAQEFSAHMILLYVACMFWTLGYDTIYGHQDRKYDKKIGIKSTSITFENHTKIVLAFFYTSMTLCLILLGILEQFTWIFYAMLTLAATHLTWQILSLDTDSPQNCGIRFKSNIYLGGLVFLAFLLDRLWK